jgi:hypothetical protein
MVVVPKLNCALAMFCDSLSQTQSRFGTRRLQQCRVELLADLPQEFRGRFSKVIKNEIRRGGGRRRITDEVQENRVFVGIKLTQEATTQLGKYEQHVRDPRVACSRTSALLLALVPVLRC